LPDFFLKKLRVAVKEENPNALILGEVWEDASNKIAYGVRREYFQGAELDSVMNYPLKDAIIQFILTKNTLALRTTIAQLIDNYPKAVLDSLMNILGTHDTARILTVLGGKTCRNREEMSVTSLSETERASAIERLKMAALLQFTLPGVPSIFYGDEVGMEGYSDPFCRACFPWDNINDDLLQFYRKLAHIRRSELACAFRDGEYKEVYADHSCLVFGRKSETQTAYIYINLSSEKYNIHFKGKLKEHLTGTIFTESYSVSAYSFGIMSVL